jgi:Skp family chaperone for outer membrane proteins
MSLTNADLQAIRATISHEVSVAVRGALKEELQPIRGELKALRNDIKDIYDMLAELQKGLMPDKQFQNLTLEQKLLRLNAELLAAAKQAGISLPR